MADQPIQPEKRETPPPIKIKSAEKKSDTARIDLSTAKPPSDTTRLDLTAARPKAETSRLDAAVARPQGDTTKLDTGGARPKPDTSRVDLAAAKPPPSIIDKSKLPPDAEDYFKRSTMRIDLPPGEGASKSDTTRIDIPTGDAAKRQTSKIDLSAASAPSKEEIFKAKTVPVGIPTPSPTAPLRPKTIQMKRPAAVAGESIIVSPESTASATEQARKSETARIDLSAADADRPATRPKTIRIKRPDGTSARKALTISRPAEEAAPEPAQEEPADLESVSDEETPGTLVAVMAIAAVLVMCVLLYVLMAQTIAPTLAFPGRI